jgi:hypothetical protein
MIFSYIEIWLVLLCILAIPELERLKLEDRYRVALSKKKKKKKDIHPCNSNVNNFEQQSVKS